MCRYRLYFMSDIIIEKEKLTSSKLKMGMSSIDFGSCFDLASVFDFLVDFSLLWRQFSFLFFFFVFESDFDSEMDSGGIVNILSSCFLHTFSWLSTFLNSARSFISLMLRFVIYIVTRKPKVFNFDLKKLVPSQIRWLLFNCSCGTFYTRDPQTRYWQIWINFLSVSK